ncbi:MAG: putative DNA repair helicase [Streblomastix strix]|uniref:Putative DNA repair helicase n=1 Tax=Streblomastix strix TaxID=222440 RepID=A0A5J4X0W6_9EUKA|nr:MAG: putative DNA repair helicase [Streblomastix strix]
MSQFAQLHPLPHNSPRSFMRFISSLRSGNEEGYVVAKWIKRIMKGKEMLDGKNEKQEGQDNKKKQLENFRSNEIINLDLDDDNNNQNQKCEKEGQFIQQSSYINAIDETARRTEESLLDLDNTLLQFAVVDTASRFKELLNARAIIFIGGTISPVMSLALQLLPPEYIPSTSNKSPVVSYKQQSLTQINQSVEITNNSKILQPSISQTQILSKSMRFTSQIFDHVLKKDHFKALIISTYSPFIPSSSFYQSSSLGNKQHQLDQRPIKQFIFTLENRQNQEQAQYLWQLIYNAASQIPDGIIVFFSSYALMDNILDNWRRKEQDQINKTIKPSKLDSLNRIKRVFIEERGKGANVNNLIQDYKQEIDSSWKYTDKDGIQINSGHNGAMLLCVTGGKLSEGINFPDGYARAVFIVGLPFANRFDPILKARLNFCAVKHGKQMADQLYEDMCIRTVNQAVGRCIRHSQDYGAAILVDARYSQDNMKKKLPNWVKESLVMLVESQKIGQEMRIFFKQFEKEQLEAMIKRHVLSDEKQNST